MRSLVDGEVAIAGKVARHSLAPAHRCRQRHAPWELAVQRWRRSSVG